MQAVKMYTTAVCPYCQQAKQLLKRRGVEQVEEVRIDQIPGEREKMMAALSVDVLKHLSDKNQQNKDRDQRERQSNRPNPQKGD